MFIISNEILFFGLEPLSQILVPQHTLPVEGQETINDIVTTYRDAIQYVHDQTVRYMNKGLSGLEIANIVKHTPHLINYLYCI